MGMRLARGFGDDCLAVMVRDPFQIYIYWTLTDETHQKLCKVLEMDTEVPCQIRVLRTWNSNEHRISTVEYQTDLPSGTNGWYISGLVPGQIYDVQIGAADGKGDFTAMLDSGLILLPPMPGFEFVADGTQADGTGEGEGRQVVSQSGVEGRFADSESAQDAAVVLSVAGGIAPIEMDPFPKWQRESKLELTQQPSYDQPSYDQPSFGQPSYAQPSYAQPGYSNERRGTRE